MDSILDGFKRVFTFSFNATPTSPIIEITNSVGSRFSVRVNDTPEVFAISSLQFAVSGSTANSVVLSLVDPLSVTYMRLFSFGNTPAFTTGAAGSGVIDFSPFQNLTSLNFGVLGNNIIAKADTVYIVGAGTGAALNAGSINCVTFTTDGNAISLVPPPPTRLQKMVLVNNRLGSLTIPAGYNALTEIQLGDGAATGSNAQVAIGTIDISGAPNMARLFANDTFALNVIFPAGFATAGITLDLNRSRISATNFAGGGVENVRAAVAANTTATTLRFRQSALSGAEQAALITAAWTNRASRPQTGTRAISLDFNSVTLGYPNIAVGNRCNAGIVDLATRSRIADLVALGWSVGFNFPVMKIEASGTAGRLVLTYEGDLSISIWAIGDTITQTTAQAGGYLATGNYTVVSGAGKVWEITATFAVAPGAVVVRGIFNK